MRPDLGEVERVRVHLLRLVEGHGLHVHGPARVAAVGDGVEQVADGEVGVVAGHLAGLTAVEVADALWTWWVDDTNLGGGGARQSYRTTRQDS